MKKLCIVACGIAMSFFSIQVCAQTTQNIRGRVIDIDSKQELIGVTLYIQNSNPIIGAVTNPKGEFTFKDIPLGRYNIVANYLGYESKVIPNILVGAGKESFIAIDLTESLTQLEEVVVKANKDKGNALNDMATVSARSFTVEETKRYAGTFNDPARMVSSFAGVVSDPAGNNDIIVRGNSPKGILWRLEGIEIPNPNHFADEGHSGGPINALNSAMLDNSDFFTSAFAPEYGNAYSGVFDMKLRAGNNEKREYSLSAGALGFDGTIEGPFKPGYGGSYLINYRYSSLAILDDLGIVDFFGVPKYQDLSFKFILPAGNAGTFTLFGLGGKSSILQEDKDENNEDYLLATADFSARLGVIGLTHLLPVNSRTYIKTTVSAQGTGNGGSYQTRNEGGNFYDAGKEDFTNTGLKASTCLSFKLDAQHRFKWGLTYTNLAYKMFAEYDNIGNGDYTTDLNSNGDAEMVQAYLNWKYRITQNFTLVSGVHYLHFLYNDTYSLEPRLGMKYKLNTKSSLNFGVGTHSKVESLSTYNTQIINEQGNITRPNTDLEPTKAAHFVAGYEHYFSKNLRFNGEVYYQHLYNIPVENDITSPYVFSNESGGWTDLDLVNQGTGKNYGLEFTLERFYDNRFYFLATSSIYESKFTSLDGVERNSAFNGNFTNNILVGKEFAIGEKSKNNTIGLNTKITYYGSGYYTPIDLDKSIEENKTVYDMDKYNSIRSDNVFKVDFAVSLRLNGKNTTHEFKIDVQNITNNQAVIGHYYDDTRKKVESYAQWTIFPNVIYTLQF